MILIFLNLTACCPCKKLIPTETVNYVDTVFTIKFDTVVIIQQVNLTDTLIMEIPCGTVTTFTDTTLMKITTKFQGKIFEFPGLIPVRTITMVVPTKPKKLRFEDKFLIAVFLTLCIAFWFNRKNK